jgi:uncharacterized membrane protein YuzA (DUF378 family)
MVDKKRFTNISIITAITYIIMIILNGLANFLPINGQTSAEVSDSYSNLFAPAGYTFSIWGLIYILLGLFTIYQLGFFRKNELEEKEKMFKKIGIIFSISSLANALWILTWHFELIPISMILILTMLICLILINKEIRKWKLSFKDKMFIKIPFSIYFAWLTIASIANITVLLVSLNWNRFGLSENIWTIITLLIGLIISATVIIKNDDISYGFIIIWAYIGIYMKHISPEGWNSMFPLVIVTVTISIAVLIITIIYTIFKRKKRGLNL